MTRGRVRGAWLAAALLLGLASGAPVNAGGLSVAPITLEFRAGQRTLSATVANPGKEPMQVQVRLFRWSSEGTGETYTDTRDIGFSPPMFTLEPGERQVVRLMVRQPPSDGREAAYRLIVDQLPQPNRPGVQMPVRVVLPVFVQPAQTPAPGKLEWTASVDAGQTVLRARNTGGRRVKLFDVARKEGRVSTPIQSGLAGYVLADQARTWRFPHKAGTSEIEVTARTEAGPMALTLPLAVAR